MVVLDDAARFHDPGRDDAVGPAMASVLARQHVAEVGPSAGVGHGTRPAA